MANTPSVFIIGTMKGGTTILHDYLSEHPRIKGGSQKEIHYFSLFYDKGSKWYEEHFSHLPDETISIDASPTYFDAAHTDLIPKLIHTYNPDAKVILMVRDPIERAISHYFHLRNVNKIPELQETTIDELFARDVELAVNESNSLDFCLMQILWFSCYFRKALYYRSVFGDNFYIIENQMLRDNAQDVMNKLFDFIGVERIESPMFGTSKYNRNTSIKEINRTNYEKLSKIFYGDYEQFCKRFSLPFERKEFA